MKRKMWEKSLLTILIGVVVAVLVMGLFLLREDDARNYIFAPSYKLMSESQRNKKVINTDVLYSDDLVKIDIGFVTDCFAEDESGYYYLVPYGEENYAIIYVPDIDGNIAVFDKAYDDTWAYIDGKVDSYPDWPGRRARVALYELDTDTKDYLMNWLSGYESSYFPEGATDYESYIEPYIFCYASDEGWVNYAFIYIMLGISVISIIVGIVMGLSVPARFYKYLKQNDLSYDDVEADYDMGMKFDAHCVGSRFIFISNDIASVATILDNQKVVWAFLFTQTTTHKTYGIKTGTSVAYSVKLACDDGKILLVNFGSKLNKANEFLDYLKTNFAGTAVGYTEDLAAFYGSNRDEFVRRAKNGEFRNVVGV